MLNHIRDDCNKLEVVRGFPGSGRSGYLLRQAAEWCRISEQSLILILGASKLEKERLRLQTLNEWKKQQQQQQQGQQQQASQLRVHNCHSLCLNWFGQGKTDIEIKQITQQMLQNPAEFQGRLRHHVPHTTHIYVLVDNVDAWYITLWEFVVAILRAWTWTSRAAPLSESWTSGLCTNTVQVLLTASPWWQMPRCLQHFFWPPPVMHQQRAFHPTATAITTNTCLGGSKWVLYEIAHFLHYLTQHPERPKVLLALPTTLLLPPKVNHQTSTADAPQEESMLVVDLSSSSNGPRILQAPPATTFMTEAKQWRDLRHRLFTHIDVRTAQLVPWPMLAEILCRCTTQARIGTTASSTATAATTKSATAAATGAAERPRTLGEMMKQQQPPISQPPHSSTTITYSVSDILHSYGQQQQQLEALLQKYVHIKARTTMMNDSTAMQRHSEHVRFLHQHANLFPFAIMGHLVPIMLQTVAFKLPPMPWNDLWTYACDLGLRRTHGHEPHSLALLPQFHASIVEAAIVKLHDIIVQTYEFLSIMWHRASGSSGEEPKSSGGGGGIIPPRSLLFEREVVWQQEGQSTKVPLVNLRGRIDLSIKASDTTIANNNALLIEIKCKHQPLTSTDVLQLALYQAICAHRHALLIQAFKNQVWDIEMHHPEMFIRDCLQHADRHPQEQARRAADFHPLEAAARKTFSEEKGSKNWFV